MAKLIRLKVGDKGTVLVEASDGQVTPVGAASPVLDMLDKTLDHLVQNEIVENCRVLVQAFEQVKELSIKPSKATAEFGLTFTSKGDIYLVSASAEASYKVTFEWTFS